MSVSFTIPELETERFRLRLPHAHDFEAYAAFRGSDRSRTVGGPHSRVDSFVSLSAIVGQWQLRGYGRWIVADKATDAAQGVVGVYHPEDWPEAEIGWTVFEHAEGRGVAFEAAAATRAYVFETLGWPRIVSMIDDKNTRSVALAKRLKAEPEDTFDHPEFGPLRAWRHVPNGGLSNTPGAQSVYRLCTSGAAMNGGVS